MAGVRVSSSPSRAPGRGPNQAYLREHRQPRVGFVAVTLNVTEITS
jgi:hypothetical protein